MLASRELRVKMQTGLTMYLSPNPWPSGRSVTLDRIPYPFQWLFRPMRLERAAFTTQPRRAWTPRSGSIPECARNVSSFSTVETFVRCNPPTSLPPLPIRGILWTWSEDAGWGPGTGMRGWQPAHPCLPWIVRLMNHVRWQHEPRALTAFFLGYACSNRCTTWAVEQSMEAIYKHLLGGM